MRLAGTIGPWAEPYRARAVTWWGGRTTREKRLLAVLGAILVVALVLTLVVRPLQAARAEALADIRTYQTLRTRILAAGPAFLRAPMLRRTGDPATVLTSSAAAGGVTVATVSGLSVRIAGQPFDAVMRWVADLAATSDLRVARMTLTRGASPGLVDGELEFVR